MTYSTSVGTRPRMANAKRRIPNQFRSSHTLHPNLSCFFPRLVDVRTPVLVPAWLTADALKCFELVRSPARAAASTAASRPGSRVDEAGRAVAAGDTAGTGATETATVDAALGENGFGAKGLSLMFLQ